MRATRSDESVDDASSGARASTWRDGAFFFGCAALAIAAYEVVRADVPGLSLTVQILLGIGVVAWVLSAVLRLVWKDDDPPSTS